MMPAFSPAMASAVSPSLSVWSKPMVVMAQQSGLHDVGAIEAPAEADLDDGPVRALHGEVLEGQGGEHLEVGGGAVGGGLVHALGVHVGRMRRTPAMNSLGGDHASVDADALAVRDQVGRGEQAGALAGAAQQLGGGPGGAALALGAGDVEDVVAAFGVAEGRQQVRHAAQVQGVRVIGPGAAPLVVHALFEEAYRHPRKWLWGGTSRTTSGL